MATTKWSSVESVDVVVKTVCEPLPVNVNCWSANDGADAPAWNVTHPFPAALGNERVWSAVLTINTPDGIPSIGGVPDVAFRSWRMKFGIPRD